MKFHHFLPPPHMVALIASSALAFAAGAYLMHRRRLPVLAQALGQRARDGARSWRERFALWRSEVVERNADRRKAERQRQSNGPSGNSAFDEYRATTIRRLEDEEREFQAFFAKLRHAKDKAEFDEFVAERRAKSQADEPPEE